MNRLTAYILAATVAAAATSHRTRAQEQGLEVPRLPQSAAAVAPEPGPLPPPHGDAAPQIITLAEAERLAGETHPALREASAQVRALGGKWLQVGLRPNPTVAYSGSEIGDEGRAGQQGGYVGQEFVTAGKLGWNRSVVFHEQQAAEQRLTRTQLQVLTTVRRYYFEALVAERSVTLAHQLTDIAARSVAVSEQRLKALDVPKTSLLQSQIESESSQLLEQQASERYQAAWRRLSSVTGMPGDRPQALEDVLGRPLPELDYAAVSERLKHESPDLAELRFAVDQARANVGRATAGRVPNLSAQAGVQRDNATRDNIANVQVSIPLPIFDRNQGGITEASGQLAAAQAALEARELSLDQQLSIALRDYRTARERVTKYTTKILPAAQETLGMMNQGYQQGQLDYLQVLTVQQTYAAKNLSYLHDLETAWKEWAEIEGLLVGELPQTSIDRVAERPENILSR